jgi:hypothetical protein
MQLLKRRTAAFLLLQALLLAMPAMAHISSLSTEQVREAYFFGRSSDRAKVAEFLGRYRRIFTLQDKPICVGTIELFTPYQRIVRTSWSAPAGYSAQNAERDYSATGDMIDIRVYLVFDNSHPDQTQLYSDSEGRVLDHRANFWRDYQFRVLQGEAIKPRQINATTKYGCCGGGLLGVIVDLKFDAENVAPRETKVEVVAPDGQTTTAVFALDQLK